MIRAVYRPRHDDVLLIDDADPASTFAIPRREAIEIADALRDAADTPLHADRLAYPPESAWSAR